MPNTLVACGGTGAHVALALLRFHLLGYPLGFFSRESNRRGEPKPLDLPRFYLVDQDSGTRQVEKEEDQTAWQRVGTLLSTHPGCDDWRGTIGRPELPRPLEISPLPLGANEDWFDAPNDIVANRFVDSRYAEVLMSERQRQINFSLGMMGSPAIGSLLFRLKSFDQSGARLNRDGEYQALLGETSGRVVVVGSGVGGTGASTAPTLAQKLDPANVQAMVVMVLNWFHFGIEELSGDVRGRAQARNQMMVENANSALAYYGGDLANAVATVPVGIPQDAWVNRRYTSDNQQPTHEAYVHGVGALCALRHFLDAEAYEPGLYQMRAEDPMRLGGGTSVPGGTLQDLADQASTLASTLRTFANVLTEKSSGRWTHVSPALRNAVSTLTAAEGAGAELADLADGYGRHVDWMKNTLGIVPRPIDYFANESASRRRLTMQPIKPIAPATDPEPNARALFHWTAAWVREYYRSEEAGRRGLVASGPARAVGAYWPAQLAEGEGVGLGAGVNTPGHLAAIPPANVGNTLKGFVDADAVSQNGWPHPVAAPGHYRSKIRNDDAKAKRQLEVLLVSLVLGHLRLEALGQPENPEPVSLERLLSEYRTEPNERLRDVAAYQVVYDDGNRRIALAFNAPETLFCPSPWSEGDRRARAWAALWRQLTGSEQADKWMTDEASWNVDAQRAVRQIQSWLVDLKSQTDRYPGTAPAWTHILGPLPPERTEDFGTGEVVRAYWGEGDGARMVDIPLPTREIEGFWRNPDNEITEANDLAKLRKETRECEGYKTVSFTPPARGVNVPQELSGYWRGHLEELRRLGIIAAFDSDPSRNQLFLQLRDRKWAMLPNTRILDPATMTVDRCRPLEQDPIPGSGTPEGALLYPHLPLRSDYIELVRDDHSMSVVSRLPSRLDGFIPEIDVGGSRDTAVWRLAMRGCPNRVQFSVKISDGEKGRDRAHWMIWPRFRSDDLGHCWRAYYVYEHCTNDALRVETLWLDPDRSTREDTPVVRRGPLALDRDRSRPVSFRSGNERRHVGGPPIAFNLRDEKRNDEEMGLYLIPLNRVDRTSSVEVGIDFGTSHSVASATGDGGAELVPLAPELHHGKTDDRVTLHVSENWDHVKPSDDRARRRSLSVSGGWLPTYVDSVEPETIGILPSELLTPFPLQDQDRQLSDWQPYRDYTIPFLGVQRANIADFVLSDFKWKVTKRGFRNQEPLLRRMYLAMLVELVMADIVRRKGFMPEEAYFTFTYPLRTPTSDVRAFIDTLRKVLADGSSSLGIQLGLTKDKGIYSESRAAKGGTNTPGEVSVVGDLGGGTLDLFISAEKLPGQGFEEVADSARLGANLLLRTLAEHEKMFLPRHNSWGGSVGQREMQLRMWMRAMGAKSLFGMETSGNPPVMPGTRVQGFAKMAGANNACALIDRYFRLIVDYMSRSIVAYLARHWYPLVEQTPSGAVDNLRLRVYLRGNGWRVWYGTDDYQVIRNTMKTWIEERAKSLWRTMRKSDPNLLDRDFPSGQHWAVGTDGDAVHHKDMPIRQALGQAESHEDVANSTYTHALVDLFVHRKGDKPRRVAWHEALPFEIAEQGASVVLSDVAPPLQLGDPRMDRPDVLASFEDQLLREINMKLSMSEAKVDYRGYNALVGPVIWEAAFKSAQFIKKGT